MTQTLWIAQYNSESGGDETLVLLTEKPTAKELAEWKDSGQKLENLYELAGPDLLGLPLERQLSAQ